jgi:hypothetical protein
MLSVNVTTLKYIYLFGKYGLIICVLFQWETPKLLAISEMSYVLNCFRKLLVRRFR